MSAPFTFRGPTVGLVEDEEEPAEAPDEEPDLPPSPDEIQIDAADVGQFDETYLARSQNFKLEGQFSPAPFPLQVIPRVAYTINYNFVYNEQKGRWEADTGNDNRAVRSGVAEVPLPSAPPDDSWGSRNTNNVSISFGVEFTEPPTVVAHPQGLSWDEGLAGVENITTSGCAILYGRFATQQGGVNDPVQVGWVAVGERE